MDENIQDTQIMLMILDSIESHLDKADEFKYKRQELEIFAEKLRKELKYYLDDEQVDPFDRILIKANNEAEIANIEKSVAAIREKENEERRQASKLAADYKDWRDVFGHSLLHLSVKNDEKVFVHLLHTDCFDVRETTNYGLMPIQLVSYFQNPSVTAELVDTGYIKEEDFFYKVKKDSLKPINLFKKGTPILEARYMYNHLTEEAKEILTFMLPKAFDSAYVNGVRYGDYEMVALCMDAAYNIAEKLHPDNEAEAGDLYRLYLGSKTYDESENAMIVSVKNQDTDMICLLSGEVSVFEEDKNGHNAIDYAKSPKYFDKDLYECVKMAKDDELKTAEERKTVTQKVEKSQEEKEEKIEEKKEEKIEEKKEEKENQNAISNTENCAKETINKQHKENEDPDDGIEN